MKKLIRNIFLMLALSFASVYANSSVIHKVVIQVSTNDVKMQNIALNNAVNLQKYYGMDNVVVEVVAYGPGLSILTNKSKFSKRVSSLAMSDIRFSACHNTMLKIKKKTGKLPHLSEGVKIVPAGVVRIAELEEQGYAYIRP
ncbi:MAG: DsrE family protein [Sulfurospirillaceae bacterium]|nr:DsrE family protein [Sulfurospirillaceae bacterium]